MSSKWIKILIAVLALVVVGFWAMNYKEKAQNTQNRGYKLYAMLELLKERHHEVSDQVLKSALYQLYNNDLLNADLKELNLQIQNLQSSQIYTTNDYPKTRAILDEIIAHQLKCNRDIETFKRENAKIKNSFSFLISSVEHLNLLDKQDTQKILDIIVKLINVKASMEIKNFDESSFNIEFLDTIEPKNGSDKLYLSLYKRHIDILKKYLPSYIILVNRLIQENSINEMFVDLYTTIKEENASQLKKLDFEYYSILLFSVLTLFVIVYYILALEREKQHIIQLQDDYNHSITTDMLTGLKNRSAYIEKIKSGDNVIILFDIVDFSSINNLYGIEIGDFILQKLAKILEANVKSIENTDIFRVGADTFAVILQNYSLKEVELIAQNLLEVIERASYRCDKLEQEIFIQLLAGISSKQPYLLNATLAIKSIAEDYSQKIAVYDDTLDRTQEIQKNLTMIQKIKSCLVNDNVTMLFQPLIDLKTKEITKYEALVRMKDNDEYISPYFFLELSKKAKLYTQITHEVILKSVQAVREKNVNISINLSIEDILHKKTYDFIFNTLHKNKDIASKITFELLESEEIHDFNALKEFITEVKKFGVSIAIDDFGSGYSNYNYLLELDIDILKIDGSLIKNIDKSKNNQLVVRSIIEFAKLADIETVAEFVASKEIEEVVVKLGVDYGQGFYYSAPKLL